METSFCELKGKEVINITDGKKLGRIIDIVFDTSCGRVLGIVVPAYNKSWNIFKASDDIFIPFACICKFGEDAILVKIFLPDAVCKTKKAKFAKTAQTQNYPNTYANANVQNANSPAIQPGDNFDQGPSNMSGDEQNSM